MTHNHPLLKLQEDLMPLASEGTHAHIYTPHTSAHTYTHTHMYEHTTKIIKMFLKPSKTGEMVKSTHILLFQRTLVRFLLPMLIDSQPLVTPALRYPTPWPPWELALMCTARHTDTQTERQTDGRTDGHTHPADNPGNSLMEMQRETNPPCSFKV